MDRKTLKLLLSHEEFKDLVQAYIDYSETLDGELVDVFYGTEYQAVPKTITHIQLKNSGKFGGNVEMKFDEGNKLVMEAISMWIDKNALPFIVNHFERMTLQERSARNDNGNSSLYWMVEVRTK